jgi:hypothetical protein
MATKSILSKNIREKLRESFKILKPFTGLKVQPARNASKLACEAGGGSRLEKSCRIQATGYKKISLRPAA